MIDRRGHRRGWLSVTGSLAAPWAVSMLLFGCAPTESATATDGPLPTPAPTAVSVASPCAPADLEASHGLVEGAAGSRFTTVVLVAAVACAVDSFPALGLRDATGTVLVGAVAGGPGRVDLVAGASYESNVRLGNWCADQPTFPLDLAVIIGGVELPVTGDSFAGEGDLPPCSGDGGPILEATAWVRTP